MASWRKCFQLLKITLYNAPTGVAVEMVILFRESCYVWNK